MERHTKGGRLDGRILRNIHVVSRQLARARPIRCFDAEDYAQDLTLDLLRRRKSFDPGRATFATFADRVVRHRASDLASPTGRKNTERSLVSLNAAIASGEGETEELIELLPDETPPLDLAAGLAIDVRRFVENLPDPLLVCCEVLMADSIAAGSAEAGIHRSTAYERAVRLRIIATECGLDAYLSPKSDTSEGARVCGGEGSRHGLGADPETPPMRNHIRPSRPTLLVNDADLHIWLAAAKSGDLLEYHRGVLTIDRLQHGSRLVERDREQLHKVASRLFALAMSGRGYLLQRRHGNGDYSYLFVARGCPDRITKASLLLSGENRR